MISITSSLVALLLFFPSASSLERLVERDLSRNSSLVALSLERQEPIVVKNGCCTCSATVLDVCRILGAIFTWRDESEMLVLYCWWCCFDVQLVHVEYQLFQLNNT